MKKIRSDAEWHQLIAEQQQSDLSAAEYCRQNKLCAKHFSKRKRELGKPSTHKQANAFVPIIKTAPSEAKMGHSITLQQGTLTIDFPLDVSSDWLCHFVKGLTRTATWSMRTVQTPIGISNGRALTNREK